MRKKKIYDDEWRAKRVFTKLDRKSKSTYSFKNTIGVYKNSVRKNGTITKKPPKKQTEVVVKITGASRNYGSLKAHLRYISRNGELAVEINTNEVFQDRENLKYLADSFNDYKQDIPTESFLRDNNLKEKREALHIVFSMRDIEHASPSKIKESAMKTIDELYPNNHYAIAFHGDTDNPHCHLVLKVKDINGKRINPKKSDLALMRLKFAENLRKLNVEAKATINKNNIDFEKNEWRNDKPIYLKGDNKKAEHKAHHYEVINFGKAHYKFDTDNKMSYFVRYRTSKGKDIEIWADDLERVIEQNQIQKGEFVRFAITDETPVEIKIQDKKTKQWYQKTVYKKIWDASIEKRDEKILNPLKKFTPNDYQKIDDPMNTIIEFGEAKFNNDENNAISFFVTMQNYQGKKYTIWGKELKNLIEENGLEVGSECLFEREKPETKTEKFAKTKWKVKTPQGTFYSSDSKNAKFAKKDISQQKQQSDKDKEIE